MRIKLSQIYVEDQDRARAFYTDVLGFAVRVDAAYSETARWLTVYSPEDPDGAVLLLGVPDENGRALQQSQKENGRPAMVFETDDCRAEYERLRDRGVAFAMAPMSMPYGGTDAMFDDTCGNLICLHQN